MPVRQRKRQQLGPFWLWQRADSGTWCICWLERHAGGRSVTRRKATAIRGGVPHSPPQEAQDALAAHYLETQKPEREAREVALVENLLADWLRFHVAGLAAPSRYVVSVTHWMAFFDDERRGGRVGQSLTVADITPAFISRFIKAREEVGVGGHTISRDLAALRSSLNWAWKNHRLDHPPYIADVPAHQKAPARSRVLSFEELGRMLDGCAHRPEREHLVRFIVVELGIAGRPQAVLELTQENIDLENNLIDPNQPGRNHTRKRRPVVPIAQHVRPWVEGVSGKLIRYRVPITNGDRDAVGAAYLERDTASIKTAWNTVCREAEVQGATPKTLRHTMLTWLAKRGVPKEQRMALAGHSAQDTTARNYEHLEPDYLHLAIREVDAFFEELSKHTKVHLRSAGDTRSRQPRTA